MRTRQNQPRPLSQPILVVDDDLDDQLVLGLALKEIQPGLHLHYAKNGQEALDYVLHSSIQPLLLITDMHMPLLDGAGLVGRLRAQDAMQQGPMVVLSSLPNESDRQRCYQAGASWYLAKPPSYWEELRLAQELIRAWLPQGLWPTRPLAARGVAKLDH